MKGKKTLLTCTCVALMAFPLFYSCSSESPNDSKIIPIFNEQINSLVYVDNNDLIEMSKNNQDYILLLFSDCGCGGNQDSVLSTFTEYVKETKMIINVIPSSIYKKLPISLEDTYPLYPENALDELDQIPALMFYKDGKLIKKIKYTDEFKSKEKINKIIYQNVIQNGLYSLNNYLEYEYSKSYKFVRIDEANVNLLDEKIKGTASVYYTWKQCGDCFKFKHVLQDYLIEKPLPLYVFEVNHFRCQQNKQELWEKENSFPYKYQFNEYREGKLPSVVTYANSEKMSYIVPFNDVIIDNVITESFFDELVGKNITEQELYNYHIKYLYEYFDSLGDKK